MITINPLGEAVASIGDATVPDEVITLELPERSGLPERSAELRYLMYVGLYHWLAEVSLDAAGSAAEGADFLHRCLLAVGSVEPVLRFARYEQSTNVEALERASRMRGRDIGTTEGWLIPRLEGDIAAYQTRIEALRLTHEDPAR